MLHVWLSALLPFLTLIIDGAVINQTPEDNTTIDYNMDDRIIASRFQNSYPLYGFRCFKDGLRLPCDSDTRNIVPCCKDYQVDVLYAPTFYEWSPWRHCTLENVECDETQECRVKYDEVSTFSLSEGIAFRRRKKRGIDLDDPNMPDRNECQVQRAQCRLRRHGEWGQWSGVGTCSDECRVGTLNRRRECLAQDNNETLSDELCPGGAAEAVDDQPCNTDACVSTSAWEQTGRCYADDEGRCVVDAVRECTFPDGFVLTNDCATRKEDCPLNCDLLGQSAYNYGNWSGCNATCSPGFESRTGQCVYLIDNHPSEECDEAEAVQYRPCETNLCLNYEEWTNGPCDVECNGGSLTSTRTCLDGGDVPAGCDSEVRTCNEHECTSDLQITVITGNATDADTAAAVSLTIVGSLVTRTVELVSPTSGLTPFALGQKDVFEVTVTEIGAIQSIEIGHDDSGDNPSWYLEDVTIVVGATTTYDFPCGTWFDSAIGDQLTRRTLIPDEQCHQENFVYDFTPWSDCWPSCYPGERNRTGTCINNATLELSDNCEGGNIIVQTEDCNVGFCEEYSLWTQWSDCSVTCGDGYRERTRNCTNALLNVTEECLTEQEDCSEPACVEPGAWSDYGICNGTCSPGYKNRTRGCFVVGTDTPGDGCDEPLIDHAPCNTEYCDDYTSFYAESLNICNADIVGDTDTGICSDWVRKLTRNCSDGGTIPEGCDVSSELCGGDALPEGRLTDIFFFVANDHYLERPESDCNAGQVTVLNEVKYFLYKFICSYNTFQDVSISRFGVASGVLGVTEKQFTDTNLFSAIHKTLPCDCVPEEIAAIPRHCIDSNIGNVIIHYSNFEAGKTRSGVDKALIYILSYQDSGELLDTAAMLQTMVTPFDVLTGMLKGAKFAVIAAFPVDASNEIDVWKVACADTFRTTVCDNYLGSIYNDEPGVMIDRLNVVLDKPGLF